MSSPTPSRLPAPKGVPRPTGRPRRARRGSPVRLHRVSTGLVVGLGKCVLYSQEVAFEVHCINSGQGNSIVLQLPDGAYMVVDIDCSGDTPVDPVSYLKELVPEEYDVDEGKYVRRLACAAFTHPHQDHVSGLKPLVGAGFVLEEIWDSGHRLSVSRDMERYVSQSCPASS